MRSFLLPILLFAAIPSMMAAQRVQAEEITIYSSDAFPPQVYLRDGKPSGFVPALFGRLSGLTGDTYKFVLLPWKRAINESTAGHGGIVNFSRTEQRDREFDFSVALYRNKVELTVLKERAVEFKTADDLKGKTFGIPLGASFGGDFEQQVNQKIYFLEPDSQPVSRVRKLFVRRVDVAVLGQSYMKFSAKADPYLDANQDKLMILPFTVLDDWEYLAFPKSMHMQAALQRVNTAFATYRTTKAYQQLVEEYLDK